MDADQDLLRPNRGQVLPRIYEYVTDLKGYTVCNFYFMVEVNWGHVKVQITNPIGLSLPFFILVLRQYVIMLQ